MASLVRTRSLSKHAHFRSRKSLKRAIGKGDGPGNRVEISRIFCSVGGEGGAVRREISFFQAFFFMFLEFSTISTEEEEVLEKERIVMDRDGGSGEFVSFVTTGFRFRKGFKERGGLAEKLKRLFFETPRPKLERREQRFSTVLAKFSSSPRYYAAPRERVV